MGATTLSKRRAAGKSREMLMGEGVSLSFGDKVKVIATSETEELGVANRIGQVFGTTIPSATGVFFAGNTTQDLAIAVQFDELPDSIWFAPELLEFVDHAPATRVTIGAKKFKRGADGVWMKDE